MVLQGGILDEVVLYVVAPATVTTQIDGMVRHVMYVVVSNYVSVARREVDAGPKLLKDSDVMNVVVLDAVEPRILEHGPRKANAVCARVFDLVELNAIAEIVAL